MTGRSRFRFRFRGVMSLVKSIASQFFDILQKEEAASNTNVFYDPADLTSLRVGRDGSGGQPVVGDPVGMMLDTSPTGSQTMAEFIAGQPETLTDGDFANPSDWTNGTISGGQATINPDGTTALLSGEADLIVGEKYLVTIDIATATTGDIKFHTSRWSPDIILAGLVVGQHQFVMTALRDRFAISHYSGSAMVLNSVSAKHLPGHHAIAPSDSARPVLYDEFDLTAAALTDNGQRGEELVNNSDIADWNINPVGSPTPDATVSGGVLTLYRTGGNYHRAYQDVAVEIGELYEFTFTTDFAQSLTYRLGTGGLGGSQYASSTQEGPGTVTIQARAFESTMGVVFIPSDDGTINITSISVRKVLTAFDERGAELEGSVFSPASTANGQLVETGLGNQVQAGKFYEIVYNWVNNNTAGFFEIRMKDGGSGYSQPFLLSNQPASGTRRDIWYVNTTGTLQARWFFSGASGDVDVTVSVKEVIYPNLVTNGTFDTDSGWTKSGGGAPTISGGVADFANNSTGASNLEQSALTFPFQSWAKIQLYASAVGDLQVRLNGAIYYLTTVIGWNTLYHRSGADTNGLRIRANFTNDYTGSIDNVSVQELPASIDRKYYLDTDGSDDWMQVTPTLDLGEQWWHVGAWQSDVGGNVYDRAFATSNSFYGAPIISGGKWSWWNAAGNGLLNLTTEDVTNKHVLTIEQSDTNSLSARYDGVTEANPITPYDDSGSTQGLALFSQQNNVFVAGLDGRFYGGSWGQGQVDYDELTVLQDYLGTTTQPPIDPPDVTEYADVYELLAAQTGAVLFDINDKTSLRVGRDGSGGVPVDGDPVGIMMDVSGTGGQTMAAYAASQPEVFDGGTFDSDLSAWSDASTGLANSSVISGQANINNGAGDGLAGIAKSFTTTANQWYIATVDLVSTLNGARFGVGVGANNVSLGDTGQVNTAGSLALVFQASGATTWINLYTFPNAVTTANQTSIFDNISVKEISSHAAIAPSDSARPNLASYNSPISSREVLTTTYGWNITDGGRA